MVRVGALVLCAIGLCAGTAFAGADPSVDTEGATDRSRPVRLPPGERPEPTFSWQVHQLPDNAELVTLSGRFDHDAPSGEGAHAQRQRQHLIDDSVPLLSVLRDTLGTESSSATGNHLLSLWLFTDSTPSMRRRILSALPFNYHRTNDNNPPSRAHLTRLADLGTPEAHPFSSLGHDIVQWTLLDGIAMPVRASSRSYRTNELGEKRLYLEEASTFLQLARESGAPCPLSEVEMNHIIARLRLLKQSFGGLTGDRNLDAMAEAQELSRHVAEGRNWEILRQAAEKTGLIFEPLEVGDAIGEYAMLWYSPQSIVPEDSSPATRNVFKILNISNVRHDRHLEHWKGDEEVRAFDVNGALLPRGESGVTKRELIPLAVYSLDYNRQPLLLIDFRDPLHTSRREISQRVIEDVVHNVLGLSYMTNWYFFAAKAAISFVESRHGMSLDAADRADCYARFRVALMLDKGFDSDFRTKLSSGLNRMSIDPLEVAPEFELEAAKLNYNALQHNVEDPKFAVDLDKQRRYELATSRESGDARLWDSMLHLVTLGAYTHREPVSDSTRADLVEERRRLAALDFLEKSTREGVDPGLSDNRQEVAQATAQLATLMNGPVPTNERRRAAAIASKLSTSKDANLVAGSSSLGIALAATSSSSVKGE